MLMWFSVTPIGTGSGSVSREVANAVMAVEALGLPTSTDGSGTTVEGTWEECTQALRVASEAVLADAPRAGITCKFDVRRDKPSQSLADKESSLRQAASAAGPAPEGKAST